MPKVCKTENCSNPRWSRATGMCKNHHIPDKKPKVKKMRQKIKQVSSKRANQNQLYTIARRVYLKANPVCQFPNCREEHKEKESELQVHHKRGRNGDRLLDTKYWMGVCDKHHKYIELNREEAFKKGWLIKRN